MVLLLPVFDKGNKTNKGLRLKGPLESSFNIQVRDTPDCEIARRECFILQVYHFI